VSRQQLITLLTDFGTADGYVGEVKGVILAAAPEVAVVDISHEIGPQDVEGARLALARYWRRFPPGTVHVVVVDPGVGSGRAALAVFAAERFLVGPDNGVLSPALLVPGARAVQLEIPSSAAPTFHGRDVFAPAAAALARGAPLETLGAPATDVVIRRTPEPVRNPDGSLLGVVLTSDRFGNLITNLVGLGGGRVTIAGVTLPVVKTYAEVEPGAAVALVGSSGLLEVAVREGSAAQRFNASRGATVVWRP
jgi:S-adenosylmethionine hydrolase